MSVLQYIGISPASQEVLSRVRRIAPTPLPVHVTGETGTGKEIVARMLHHTSKREGAFTAIDCASLSKTLVESELFGHVRGAFTGASRHRHGLIAAANGGSVFLDEVADLPLATQTRLLRVLQEGTYRPVGSEQEVRANTRFISASWKPLETAVQAGTFREDLYHRLAVAQIHLPPLRDRTEDIRPLVEHFQSQTAESIRTPPKRLTTEVWHALHRWPWPGNIRELKNCISYVQAMTEGPSVHIKHLPPRMLQSPPVLQANSSKPDLVQGIRTDLPYMEARRVWLDAFQVQYVGQLLEEHKGNVSATARAAGMDRRSIQRILNRIKPSSKQ